MEWLLVKKSYNSYRQSSTKFTVTSTIKKTFSCDGKILEENPWMTVSLIYPVWWYPRHIYSLLHSCFLPLIFPFLLSALPLQALIGPESYKLNGMIMLPEFELQHKHSHCTCTWKIIINHKSRQTIGLKFIDKMKFPSNPFLPIHAPLNFFLYFSFWFSTVWISSFHILDVSVIVW